MKKKSFFIDIDGVLYGKNVPDSGGPEALAYLREYGHRFLLVTNTSRMSQKQIANKLINHGYEIDLDEIFPVSLAAVDYLNIHLPASRCFLIGDRSLGNLLETHGFSIFTSEQDADVVIIGQCKWPSFSDIDIARRIIEKGAKVIALHKDAVWPDEDKIRIGLGPVVAALESVISIPVTIIGKPQKKFFDLALNHAEFCRENTIMIGDSVDSDIYGGINAGLETLLVRTGNGKDAQMPLKCTGELETIAKLPDWCKANS